MNRGLLIAFEGIDCSGKSTQSKILHQNLPNSILMSYPNEDSYLGKYIRQIINKQIPKPESQNALHMLFTANRWENNSKIYDYLVNKKQNVILDRYCLSGIVYSINSGISKELCLKYETGLIKPDITIFINTKPEIACKRKGFGTDLYDNIEFQKKIYQTYRNFIETESENLFYITQSTEISAISEEILGKISEISAKIDNIKHY